MYLKKQIIIKNTHPPLITEDDFRAVQELMKKKETNRSKEKRVCLPISLNM
ncbi:recombinase family protein [Bacillus altitudinis]|uniref:recombinase family protein n=1 Tax=Bacillus altitudinis TaxID=293387 RepID=UPI0012DA5331|nr:recombinase family protein [Bacillus altitudinis]